MAIHRNKISTVNEGTGRQFYTDVLTGLSASPKYLLSKYFYDTEGDRLFQEIMQAPEYYLTRAEMEIFSHKAADIAQVFLQRYDEFDIVELGAGDAVKSTHLLRYLAHRGHKYTYYPVDISHHVLELLDEEMPKRIPNIDIQGLNGEYFEMIRQAYEVSGRRKIVLFLGSSIGNLTKQEAEKFLDAAWQSLLPGDLMLVGFDLKKNPKQILAAYNDATGVTKAFNLNLLHRINRELDADFNVNHFDHYPTYDPLTGSCRSYLISLKQQVVHINHSAVVNFEKNEPIYMELSQKYSVNEIEAMAEKTGFHPVARFFDHNKWFMDIILERK